MVAIRLHRLGIEALLDSAAQAAVSRATFEAAVPAAGAGPVQLHRLGAEVLAKVPAKAGVQRVTFEAAAPAAGAGPLQLHRLGVEALVSIRVQVGVQRVTFEAAAPAAGAGPLQLHRLGVEILARVGIGNPVPRPLATDIEFFMHNWAEEVEIETGYTTDVVRSPITLAEERRALQQRPERILTTRWLRGGKEEIRQLRLHLRRLTSDNVQFPIYPDVAQLTDDVSAIGTTIPADISNRRFYAGGRVLFFRTTSTWIDRTSVRTAIVRGVSSLSFEIETAVGAMDKNWSVVPLIDCEILFEPEFTTETAEVSQLTLVLREYRGPNALPPLAVGNAPGFVTRLGYPVFEIESNWIQGVDTRYRRAGQEQRTGRRNLPSPDGERYSQSQDWILAPIDRTDWYRIASLFDTRQGRRKAFWAIDREFTYTVANTNAGFIEIVPYGRFVDFNTHWLEDGIAAAIRMRNGEIHLAQVQAVDDNSSTWRLTFRAGQTIEQPIDLSQIDFFSMARITRFDSDTMREVWKTDGVCEIRLSTIELQNEKVVDFD